MKRLFSRLVIISVMFLTLLSCKEKEKKVNKAVSNQNLETYQPGLDWDLVWSDEFETDTIDLNNWNYQVEEVSIISPFPKLIL